MSHSNGYRATCANYQACHLKSARLLDNSTRNVFSPRYLEMDNRTCSARTSLSVGEEPLQSRRANIGTQTYAEDMLEVGLLSTAKFRFAALGQYVHTPGDIDTILAGCGSQVGATNFTKYLELKVANIQEQHQKTQSENMQLNNQLSRATARNRQLEEKAASLEEALLREKRQRDLTFQKLSTATMQHQGVNTTTTTLFKDASTSPSESTPGSHSECAVQTLTDVTLPLDLVSISKSELAILENDMKILREAVRAKEEMWEQAMERERNYREHWARLSRELITVRAQSDLRETELKSLERKMTDQTEELRAAQKELSYRKKKLQKNQRDSADSYQSITGADNPESREMQHSKFESPRRSPVTKFRSNKMSPTKDARGATMRTLSSRDHYNVSPRSDQTPFK